MYVFPGSYAREQRFTEPQVIGSNPIGCISSSLTKPTIYNTSADFPEDRPAAIKGNNGDLRKRSATICATIGVSGAIIGWGSR